MKATRLAFALLVALSTPLFAAEGDKAKLIAHLERTRDMFLKSVDGLSEAQWSYKAAPEKWSIAQCAEHIAAAESFIRSAMAPALAAPATEELLKQVTAKDDAINSMVVDRSRKFNAPEPIAPTNRFGSPAATVEAFRKERAETLAIAQGDKDLRKYAAQHPAFGVLDGHSWILFLSAHTERHTLQIEEVKANEGYPKQ